MIIFHCMYEKEYDVYFRLNVNRTFVFISNELLDFTFLEELLLVFMTNVFPVWFRSSC